MIRLTEEERAELEARCKEYTSPYHDVVRAMGLATTASRLSSACHARSPANGVSDSASIGCRVSTTGRVAGDQPAFPPSVVVAIKALACELPSRRGLPLARWSLAELRQEAVASGIVAKISDTTLWRWLGQDALRPWRHRSWIFPRDPHFARNAGQDDHVTARLA